MKFWINRLEHLDEINVTVHDEAGNLIEIFKLKEGHLAITQGWSDERIIAYLTERLANRGTIRP